MTGFKIKYQMLENGTAEKFQDDSWDMLFSYKSLTHEAILKQTNTNLMLAKFPTPVTYELVNFTRFMSRKYQPWTSHENQLWWCFAASCTVACTTGSG